MTSKKKIVLIILFTLFVIFIMIPITLVLLTPMISSNVHERQSTQNTSTEGIGKQCERLQYDYNTIHDLESCYRNYELCVKTFQHIITDPRPAINNCLTNLVDIASEDTLIKCSTQHPNDRLLISSCIELDSIEPRIYCKKMIESGTVDYWVQTENLNPINLEHCINDFEKCFEGNGRWNKGFLKCVDNPSFVRTITSDEIAIANAGR